MGRINIRNSAVLQDVSIALRNIDGDLGKQFRRSAKSWVGPEWQAALRKHAHTQLEQQVIAGTATVAISNQNVRILAANKGRQLRGGLNPKTEYAPVEWGAKPNKKTYRRRSKNGRSYSVTRNTHAQFNAPTRGGRVFGPAADEMAPRLVSLWVQCAVRTVGEAIGGKP